MVPIVSRYIVETESVVGYAQLLACFDRTTWYDLCCMYWFIKKNSISMIYIIVVFCVDLQLQKLITCTTLFIISYHCCFGCRLLVVRCVDIKFNFFTVADTMMWGIRVWKEKLASQKATTQPMDATAESSDSTHQAESGIVESSTKTRHPKKADVRK